MRTGFTLIELLVVITIIVVLLSLLTPALDRAIYEAELAVDAAQTRGIAQGATAYTLNFKRYYPYREGVSNRDFNWRAETLRDNGIESWQDSRELTEPYFSSQIHLDPLAPEQIDLSTVNTEPAELVMSSYALYYGFGYQGRAGMFKLGNRLSAIDPRETPTKNYNLTALAACTDCISPEGGEGTGIFAQNAHQDKDGILWPWVYEHEGFADAGTIAGVHAGVLTLTVSWWIRDGQEDFRRGLTDRNISFSDGSAQTYKDVKVYIDADNRDDRMIPIPMRPNDDNPQDNLSHNALPNR